MVTVGGRGRTSCRSCRGATSLAERGLDRYEDDERTVSDLLMDQIEFADVIVLNKLDLVDERESEQLNGALTRLNPAARIVPSAVGAWNCPRSSGPASSTWNGPSTLPAGCGS